MRLFLEHLPFSVITWYVLGVGLDQSILAFFIALTFGWLIDIDHLVDYLLFLKNSSKPFSVPEFLSGVYFKETKMVILPFHSIEVSLLLLVGSSIAAGGWGDFFFIAFVSHFLHLIQDFIAHKPTLFGYSLLARYSNRWRLDWFCG